MTRSTLAIVSAFAIAGGIVAWSIHRHAAATLRKTNESYAERAGILAQLRDETSRLSNTIVQAKPADSLPDDQFRELLRLRSEVSRLRGERRETDYLRATNQQLSASLAKSDGSPPVQVRWDRDKLAFAGYADPESAMISTLWGLNNGDPNFYLSLLTPDKKALLEMEGKLEEIAVQYRKIGEVLNPPDATGISLVGKKLNSADEAVVDLYYEGEGKTRKFILKRVEGEWRLQGLALIIAN